MAKSKKPAKKALVNKSPSKKSGTKKLTAAKKAARPAAKKSVKGKKKEDLVCFLTTACVSYYGLKDDGYELTTLRKFRDNYLLSTPAGAEMVKEYYNTAPLIVSAIQKENLGEKVYKYIYRMVNKAISEIEEGQLENAKLTYSEMFLRLRAQFVY